MLVWVHALWVKVHKSKGLLCTTSSCLLNSLHATQQYKGKFDDDGCLVG
jgi:hypothetical protein